MARRSLGQANGLAAASPPANVLYFKVLRRRRRRRARLRRAAALPGAAGRNPRGCDRAAARGACGEAAPPELGRFTHHIDLPKQSPRATSHRAAAGRMHNPASQRVGGIVFIPALCRAGVELSGLHGAASSCLFFPAAGADHPARRLFEMRLDLGGLAVVILPWRSAAPLIAAGRCRPRRSIVCCSILRSSPGRACHRA